MIKKIIALFLSACMLSGIVSESVFAASEYIALEVGATQTVELSGGDTVVTGFDTSIATVEVKASESTYIEATDVTCNEVLSEVSPDWVETGYYYKLLDDGPYYPLYAKKIDKHHNNVMYTYVWGYKHTGNKITKINSENAKVTAPDPKINIDVYTMSGSDMNEVTFTGISPGTTTGSIGDTTYQITVADVAYTDTKTIHVPEGKEISIGSVGGVFSHSSLNTSVATVSHTNNTLNIHGVSQGETSVVVGDTRYLIRVDRVSDDSDNEEWDRLKTVDIEVVAIENCDVYYVINGGELHKVEGTGILLNQAYLGGIHLTFYAAPKSGYALTSMGATNAGGIYDSLGSGDIKDSEAWDAYHNNQYYSNDQLEDLLTRAIELGCHGTLLFSRAQMNTGGISSDLSFYAEPLPTMEKTIKGYFKNGKGQLQTFTDETTLSIGDTIRYQFKISELADDIEYSNIMLHDDTIGYYHDVGDYEIETSPTYTKDYTLNQEDLDSGLYTGGVFTNEAHLDYNYTSRFSQGIFDSVSQSSVSARISGLVTYGWDEELPSQVKEAILPGDKAYMIGDSVSIASNVYEPVIIVDDSANTTTTYTFSHWETDELDGADKKYLAGETFEMPTDSSVHFTGIWTSETVQNTMDLKITKSGAVAIDENQSFMFHIEGVAKTGTADISLDVVIHGNGSVVIADLPMGEYTVSEDTNWSWRYGVANGESATKTIMLSKDNDTVSFTNARIEELWLNGNAWCDNLWNQNGITPNHDNGEVAN